VDTRHVPVEGVSFFVRALAVAVVAPAEAKESIMPFATVSEVARKLGVTPRDVSDLFYKRIIADDTAPIMAGRRMIPDDLIWLIESKLQAMGKLPAKGGQHVG
jgi:hypothetical protein